MFDFLDALRKKGEKVETLALFYEDTIFGTDSSNVQRKLAGERGYKLVSDIKYRANTPSLTAEVQQLKAGNADVLMPSSYTTDSILLVKTMARARLQAEGDHRPDRRASPRRPSSTPSASQIENFISRGSFSLDLAAEAADGRQGQRDVQGALRQGPERQHGARIHGHDAARRSAIDQAKSTDGAKIRDALAATNIPGEKTIMPWKKVNFDETGQNTDADPVLLQYTGGKFVTIFPEQAAVAQAVWPMFKA